ncbi:MAG: efflux RND transporter periplasmic adaptor subunit, partial [Aeromonadaceae bacterium]
VAEIAAAKAALKSARIDLGYTKVRATISGRIGKSSVTEGALVTAQQAASLTTIQQLDPIYVDVTQSTTDLLQLRQLYASGQLEHTQDGAVVHFVLENGAAYPHSGKLEFSDVTVDETTGMVTVRALAPNPDRLLLPGMFVRAILTQGEQPNGLLVPQAAVSRTAKGGASVLLVNADNKVEQREIEVGRAFHGNWVVESGLKGGERVIVAGLQKVRPGAEVAPKDVTPATPAKQ